jgi:isopenicillin-N epimerase
MASDASQAETKSYNTLMLTRCWGLDEKIDFLNHGSFGACPLAVLEEQQELRRRMEAEPVRFLDRELEDRLDEARAALARFVGADPDDLAFLPNATAGVNTVLRSLRFEPGDEILATDMEYNACRNAADFVVGSARVVAARIPFPSASPQAAAQAVLAGVTDKTRLALLSHITSPTAIILPLEPLVRELQGRGVDVLVDGAHAPGQIPLDLARLDAAYYTGNCHKWLCAPKGAAFLHVRRDRQERVRPLSISHGANSLRTDRSRFRLESDWTGTADPTPYLCVPAAIRFMAGSVPGGWPEVMRRNHALAVEARSILSEALGVPEPCPEGMLGAMASLPLPQSLAGAPAPAKGLDPLQDKLYLEHGIEVPVFPWPTPDRKLLRLSAQLYNSRAQYQDLAAALSKLAA